MPVLRRSVFGDPILELLLKFHHLSQRQKEILEEFNEIESNKPDPVIKSFLKKLKNSGKKLNFDGN